MTLGLRATAETLLEAEANLVEAQSKLLQLRRQRSFELNHDNWDVEIEREEGDTFIIATA